MEEAVQLILQKWSQPRTTFHGRYFHVEDAILEPKPIQKPRPPVMIAGGGEQMTLRAVARLADNFQIELLFQNPPKPFSQYIVIVSQ